MVHVYRQHKKGVCRAAPAVIVAFTGHRPPKLGGYNTPNPIYNAVWDATKELLLTLGATQGVSGMALGYDQLAAQVCLSLDVELVAALPFANQAAKWPPPAVRRAGRATRAARW